MVTNAAAQSAHGFEELARAMTSQMTTSDANTYLSLLPTDAELSWIVDNVVPRDDREAYSDYYSDLSLVTRDFRDSPLAFDFLEDEVLGWQTGNSSVLSNSAHYVGHESYVADKKSQANGISHILNAAIAYRYEGIGELHYKITFLTAVLPERVVLMGYRFRNYDMESLWAQPTPALQTFVDGMLAVIVAGYTNGGVFLADISG